MSFHWKKKKKKKREDHGVSPLHHPRNVLLLPSLPKPTLAVPWPQQVRLGAGRLGAWPKPKVEMVLLQLLLNGAAGEAQEVPGGTPNPAAVCLMTVGPGAQSASLDVSSVLSLAGKLLRYLDDYTRYQTVWRQGGDIHCLHYVLAGHATKLEKGQHLHE